MQTIAELAAAAAIKELGTANIRMISCRIRRKPTSIDEATSQFEQISIWATSSETEKKNVGQ